MCYSSRIMHFPKANQDNKKSETAKYDRKKARARTRQKKIRLTLPSSDLVAVGTLVIGLTRHFLFLVVDPPLSWGLVISTSPNALCTKPNGRIPCQRQAENRNKDPKIKKKNEKAKEEKGKNIMRMNHPFYCTLDPLSIE